MTINFTKLKKAELVDRITKLKQDNLDLLAAQQVMENQLATQDKKIDQLLEKQSRYN